LRGVSCKEFGSYPRLTQGVRGTVTRRGCAGGIERGRCRAGCLRGPREVPQEEGAVRLPQGAARPRRRRARPGPADQDLPGPGLLHPLDLHGADPRGRGSGPGEQAGLPVPRALLRGRRHVLRDLSRAPPKPRGDGPALDHGGPGRVLAPVRGLHQAGHRAARGRGGAAGRGDLCERAPADRALSGRATRHTDAPAVARAPRSRCS